MWRLSLLSSGRKIEEAFIGMDKGEIVKAAIRDRMAWVELETR